MPDNVADLIAVTVTSDALGQQIKTETRKQVFCRVFPISQSEFFSAGNIGLKPDRGIAVFYADYNGEKIVEIDGARYSVYRTYRNGDEIELYCETRVGV